MRRPAQAHTAPNTSSDVAATMEVPQSGHVSVHKWSDRRCFGSIEAFLAWLAIDQTSATVTSGCLA